VYNNNTPEWRTFGLAGRYSYVHLTSDNIHSRSGVRLH